jgi:glucose/arabinose dehydrogenase
VNALATGLTHPRWLYVLPNGDVLVAESDDPADRPDDSKGIKGEIYKMAQQRAGAGVPSPDKIVLLRDNGNGTATKYVFLQHLHSPFGMALVGNDVSIADTDAVLRFPYQALRLDRLEQQRRRKRARRRERPRDRPRQRSIACLRLRPAQRCHHGL